MSDSKRPFNEAIDEVRSRLDTFQHLMEIADEAAMSAEAHNCLTLKRSEMGEEVKFARYKYHIRTFTPEIEEAMKSSEKVEVRTFHQAAEIRFEVVCEWPIDA